MDNKHYASVLEDVGALLQIKGANRFRVRAFENASRTISRLSESLDTYIDEDRVEEIDGIGESIAEDLRQIHETGTCEARESLLDELDPGLLDIMKIQGLGPKRIKKIYEELGIATIDALKEAAGAGEVSDLSGLGAKTEQSILDEIERLSKDSGRTPLPAAQRTADGLRDRVADLADVERAEIAGSLRRGRETIGDIDILVATDDPESVVEAFLDHREIADVIARGTSKTSVRTSDGQQVDLRLVEPNIFGSALHYFTGSKEHHVQLRTRAKRQGLKISEYGVFEQGDDDPIASETEEDVFEALGLDYIPPELREAAGEIEAAEEGSLPTLIDEDDVRCDIHMHTTETDGSASIKEMGEAARELGHDCIAITDHSQAVTVANGMTPERFEDHIAAIREANEKLDDIELLAGIEVDILKDGTLDMDHALLEDADWVVGSVHSHFNLEPKAMTHRLVQAIETGLLDALGHPTGRILGGRDGYRFDYDAVLEAALEHAVALEMNGSAGRLDLNAEMARAARARQVKLVLGSDAHSTRGLDEIRYALQQARRAWLEADDVLNSWSPDELRDW